MSGVLIENTRECVKTCKILVVGAGGIGCELLKNLVLTGFNDISVVSVKMCHSCIKPPLFIYLVMLIVVHYRQYLSVVFYHKLMYRDHRTILLIKCKHIILWSYFVLHQRDGFFPLLINDRRRFCNP